jgi:hypothetical protein
MKEPTPTREIIIVGKDGGMKAVKGGIPLPTP